MKLLKPENALIEELLATIRDKNTPYYVFREDLERLGELLIIEALKELKLKEKTVETPVAPAKVKTVSEEVVFIAILRAGLSLLPAALRVFPKGRLGFIGTYRNEETLQPVNYYVKFPLLKSARYVLLDPMLAMGGTAEQAVKVLLEKGIEENNITFISIVSAPEGIRRLEKFRGLTIITASVDEKLNGNGYIVPGLGDAGDRFCGTENVEVVESHGV
ncbi:uracil phosphoribosyltransferase [Phorcysia thermohydrogeniphila]|uniref:Uracil phosphoribosyltransferase n=1 Tax=Phorcysia thermohydrogeniphila TaxID=936138 RepID=A0A4R1GDV3_9BACT|nr:uracil phosphoribosyltransferase [Phorcysia thermohydrogeniphila]TCK06547.1 uracil phosphoribosyltransferase [Phorcysia thermohydrogeniphila]